MLFFVIRWLFRFYPSYIFGSCSNISNLTAAEFSDIYTLQYGIPPLVESAKSFASGELLLSAIEATESMDSAILASYIALHEFSTVYGKVMYFYDNISIFEHQFL